MVQELDEGYKTTFENSTEVAVLRTRLNELVDSDREWQRYTMEIDQMIGSNRSAIETSGDKWLHEQSKILCIEEAYGKCTLIIERELGFLAKIGYS